MSKGSEKKLGIALDYLTSESEAKWLSQKPEPALE